MKAPGGKRSTISLITFAGFPAVSAISGWNGCAAPALSWQEAQSTAFTRALCGKSAVDARSAWQSTHATPAWPWTDASSFGRATKTALPSALFASASP